MKAALLKRLKRLEEVQAIEDAPPVEFQIGYLKELPPDYTGERHLVSVGRDANGMYKWEEQSGPEPNDKRNSIPPFRVVLASPDDEPPVPGA